MCVHACVCMCVCVCVCVCASRLEVTNCDIWYIRFCLDYEQSLLVLGNQVGKVFVWDMMVEDPTKLK